MEAMKYSAMWAQVLMRPVSSFDWDTNLEPLLHRFALSWGEDFWIVRKFLLPLYDRFMESQPAARHRRIGWQNVHSILGLVANLDQRQSTVNRRYTQEIQERVPYRIGQVFRHRRYQYIGIINGWATAGVSALPTSPYPGHGRNEEDGPSPEEDNRLIPEEMLRGKANKTYYTCLYVVLSP
jgi:F-box protein 21